MNNHPYECVSAAASRWPMLALRGLVGIAFGITLVAIGDPGLGLLGFLWAAYAVVDGVLAALVASARGVGARRWGWLFLEGVVSVAAGATVFAWSGVTALGIAVVIAVRTAMSGVAELREATLLRKLIADDLFLGTSGVLSIAAAMLVLMMYPGAGAVMVVWLIAAHAVAFGLLQLALGARLYRWRRSAAGGDVSGATHA